MQSDTLEFSEERQKAFLSPETTTTMELQKWRVNFEAAVKKHMHEELYANPKFVEAKNPDQKYETELDPEDPVAIAAAEEQAANEFDYIEPDDFVSPMTIETYMRYRMQPVFKRYQNLSPVLRRKLFRLELIGIAMTAAGTLLAFLQMMEWVAFVVVLGSVVSNIISYLGLQNRLTATNGCTRELQNLQTWWESSSLVDKRTRMTKNVCVGTVEGAVLAYTQAWTVTARAAMKAMLSDQKNEEDQEQGKKSGKN